MPRTVEDKPNHVPGQSPPKNKQVPFVKSRKLYGKDKSF